jgi:hypothetical protein
MDGLLVTANSYQNNSISVNRSIVVNILYSGLVRAKAASRVALRHKDRKVTTGD